MSDRIAVINHGVLNQLDSPRTIYRHPTNSFIADFIGESTLLPVEVPNGVPKFRPSTLSINHEVGPDGSYLLVVRPEKLLLADGETSAPNRFLGTVEESIFQGESHLLIVCLDGMEIADGDPQLLNVRVANTSAGISGLPEEGDALCGTPSKKFEYRSQYQNGNLHCSHKNVAEGRRTRADFSVHWYTNNAP